MNKTIINSVLVCAFILVAGSASAQKDSLWRKNGRWSAWGVRYQTQTFGVSERLKDTCNCKYESRSLSQRGNFGFLVSYYENLNPRLAYSADFGISYGRVGTRKTPTVLAKSKMFTSLRGDVYYQLGKERQMISPYVHTGLHMQIGSLYASLPIGAGMRWMFKKQPVFITTQIDYGLGLTGRVRNSLITSVAAYMKLGPDKKPLIFKKNEYDKIDFTKDSDGDGILDYLDDCPGLKGSKASNGCPSFDTDGDGIVDDKDKCPNIPGDLCNNGCPVLDTDKDGVVDEKDNCPTVAGKVSNNGCPEEDVKVPVTQTVAPIVDPAKPVEPVQPTAPSQPLKPETQTPPVQLSQPAQTLSPTQEISSSNEVIPEVLVFFDVDKYAIRKDAKAEIERAIAFLTSNSNYKVTLTGHTDFRGSYKYNLSLSKKRVKAVKDMISAAGIAQNRIEVSYFGEAVPAKKGSGELRWQKNRRVEFTFERIK